MADIMDSAQSTDTTTGDVSGLNAIPSEPSPLPVNTPPVPAEPPVAAESQIPPVAPAASVPAAASFDSLIVPATTQPEIKNDQAPADAGSFIVGPPQVKQKKSKKGVLLAVIFLLLMILPLGVYFISQQNQEVSDIRSRAQVVISCSTAGGFCAPSAAECRDANKCEGPYPCANSAHCCVPCGGATTPAPTPTPCAPWTACPTLGKTCNSEKGLCYECKTNTSGGPTQIWAPCGGTATCPWALTNGKCCPTGGDACDYTAGGTVCINDPFNSNCQKWGDGTCPGGGGVWIANHWYTDCTTAGCGSDPNLICVKSVGPKGENLCRNKNCPTVTNCLCSGTPTPHSSPTPTIPTSCPAIKVYKGTELITDYSKLLPGTPITIVVGPAATQIRFSSSMSFTPLTTKNAQGEWTYVTTIPVDSTSFYIEVQ